MRRTTFAPTLAAFGIFGAVCLVPAQAQQSDGALVFSSETALNGLLLPYSPALFDFAVLFGRSFAEITYDARGYDPVTRSFSVSGLRIRRDALDLGVERVRVDAGSTLLQGLAVATARIDLPPPLRQGLVRLGLETVEGDVALRYRRNDARAAYAVDVQMDFPRAGSLEAQGVVDGFHILVPLSSAGAEFSEVAPDAPSPPPQVLGTLRELSVTYRDAGLLDAVLEATAQTQGVTAEQMGAGVGAMITMSAGPMLDGLPGGASPAFRERALGWARTAEDFLRAKNSIRVTFAPPEPVDLSRLQDGVVDEALITALDPSVESPVPPGPVAMAPQASADPLGAARALVEGRGVLQDREAGARALLGLAAGGETNAVRALASGFGQEAAVPDLSPDELGTLLQFLLVGRALGAPVSDSALGAVEARLAPEAWRTAERAAGDYFRTRTPQGRAVLPLSAGNIPDQSPSRLRAMALDAYEGRGIPRDRTEAYALALVASAAGDRLAEALRDDLAQAAREGRIALSVDEARTRAGALWQAYAEVRAAAP